MDRIFNDYVQNKFNPFGHIEVHLDDKNLDVKVGTCFR